MGEINHRIFSGNRQQRPGTAVYRHKKSPALRGLSVCWRLSLIGGLSGCGRRRVGHIPEQALAPRFPGVNNGPGCFPARLVKSLGRYCPRLIFFFFAPFYEPLFSSPFS